MEPTSSRLWLVIDSLLLESPLHIVMTAAHSGYNSDLQTLGGAAEICERLCALWAGRGDIRLTVLGSGPHAPPGVKYKAFSASLNRVPTSLNEWDYARFSRSFEKSTTDFILSLPDKPVVISHDVSEGPDFRRLALAGVRCIPIFHVDVVEYFNRFYLGGLIAASWWTWVHRGLRKMMPVPDVLELVFEKQRRALAHCPYVVVPSPPMEGVLRSCHPGLPQGRIQVLPWGAPISQPTREDVGVAREALLQEWGVQDGVPLLVTLSRIAPEKNQGLLLDALLLGEEEGQTPPGLTVVIAGEASFMGGQKYRRKLETKAGRLRRTRVIFSGHISGARKRALLEMAHLFIVPSRHESYGLSTMEGMAAGLPVVGLATPGVEAAVDRESGVLVADASALWFEILRLLHAPGDRVRMGEAARALAGRSNFSHAAEGLRILAAGL